MLFDWHVPGLKSENKIIISDQLYIVHIGYWKTIIGTPLLHVGKYLLPSINLFGCFLFLQQRSLLLHFRIIIHKNTHLFLSSF